MQFFTLCHQILPILTIGANIGSCPRTTLLLPHALFHFALLSRLATSRWALAIFFFFFNHLWSFWSWQPWKFCRKSLRVFTKERKNPWNVHSWPKLKIRNSSHFFRPYNKCLRSKSTGERTWNPGLQVKASVQAIDTTINDVIMVTGIIGLRTTRITGIPDILAKN